MLCPKKTSAHYLLGKWLSVLGLSERDVKIHALEPTPALGVFRNGYGDAIAVWSPLTREAEKLGYKTVTNARDCGAPQPVLLVAERNFAAEHPETVRAFLKLYLRGVNTIHNQGPEALAPDYVRFAGAWMGKTISEADAAAELRDHPVFLLEEQLELFGKDGKSPLKTWLAELVAFSEVMAPGKAYRHAAPAAVTNRFLRSIASE